MNDYSSPRRPGETRSWSDTNENIDRSARSIYQRLRMSKPEVLRCIKAAGGDLDLLETNAYSGEYLATMINVIIARLDRIEEHLGIGCNIDETVRSAVSDG